MESQSHPSRAVELLILVSIVALLAIFAAVAISSARSKQRDAVRISHIRESQTALENFFLEQNAYPSGDLLVLGAPASACLDTSGFRSSCDAGASNVLLRRVPQTIETGLRGAVPCGETRKAYCYSQREGGDAYTLQFELEHDWSNTGLRKGPNCALPDGLKAGVCP